MSETKKRYKIEVYNEDTGDWDKLDGSWKTPGEAMDASRNLNELAGHLRKSEGAKFQFRLVEIEV